MSIQRTKGKISEPYFIFIYGVSGAFKSTFASEAPGVVFIDVEGSTSHLDVERYPQPKSYDEVIEQLQDAIKDPKVKSIAIDTIDHLETLLLRKICTDAKVESIGDIGFGGGYERAKDFWVGLFNILREARKTKNIILLGHSEVKSFNDPNQSAPYDRYQIKLDKRAVALVKDLTDAVMFANFETMINVDKNTKKAKGFGGSDRFLYTEYRASHDGKNRYGLPYKIQMEMGKMWTAFDLAAQVANVDSVDVLCSQIDGLLTKATDKNILEKAVPYYKTAKETKNTAQLVSLKNRLIQAVQE